jgi:hypothetical protein
VWGDPTLRRGLELWRDAADQPAAVRALAHMVLGSFDARRGRWDSDWPAGLSWPPAAALDSGTPGWDHLGRVLALGGRPALDRLNLQRPPLDPALRAKLMDAAKRMADRPGALPPH